MAKQAIKKNLGQKKKSSSKQAARFRHLKTGEISRLRLELRGAAEVTLADAINLIFQVPDEFHQLLDGLFFILTLGDDRNFIALTGAEA